VNGLLAFQYQKAKIDKQCSLFCLMKEPDKCSCTEYFEGGIYWKNKCKFDEKAKEWTKKYAM